MPPLPTRLHDPDKITITAVYHRVIHPSTGNKLNATYDVVRCRYVGSKFITMVIRSLDDPTRCAAQSVVVDLQNLFLEYVGIEDGRIR